VIPSSTQFLLLTGLNQHAVTVSTGEFFNRIGHFQQIQLALRCSVIPGSGHRNSRFYESTP
jgi:hypothetical protein